MLVASFHFSDHITHDTTGVVCHAKSYLKCSFYFRVSHLGEIVISTPNEFRLRTVVHVVCRTDVPN